MCLQCIAVFCVIVASCLAGEIPGAEKPLCVTLGSFQEEYTLGEPVGLLVTVRNISNEHVDAYEIFVNRTEPELRLYLSMDGEKFERYRMGVFTLADVTRSLQTLKPRGAWTYRLKIVYTCERASRLAFDKPGKWWLRAQYGRMIPQPSKTEWFDSNTVEISIKEPEGVDATLWQTLRDPEFLHFMQGGFPVQEDSDVPLRVAGLVNSVSDSSYHDGLRWALREFYLRYAFMPEMRLSDDEKRLIEKALSPQDLLYVLKRLGLDRIPEPPRPFPEDPRLDATLKLDYPKETNWEQVLEDVSKQSGIRLLIASGVQLPSKGITALHWTPTLRQVMKMAAYMRGNWIREGDGYRLMPVHLGSGKAPVKSGREGA